MVQLASAANWMKPLAVLIAFGAMDALFISINAPSGVNTMLFYALVVGVGIAFYFYEKSTDEEEQSKAAQKAKLITTDASPTATASPARRREVTARKAERDINRELNRTLTSSELHTTELLLSLVEKHELDFVNIVTCIYRSAKLSQGMRGNNGPNAIFTDERFIGILKQLQAKLADVEEQASQGNYVPIDTFLPRGLANGTWALAKLGLEPTDEYLDLLHRIARLATPRCKQFKSQELANLVWAFATIFTKAPGKSDEKLLFPNMGRETRVLLTKLFQAAAQASAGNLFNYRTQELSNSVWAYSRAMHGTPLVTLTHSSAVYEPLEGSFRLFFKALARAVRDKVYDFEPQQIANTAWAFARMEVLQREELTLLLQSLAAAASEPSIAYSLKPQEVSNLIWSLAKAGVDCPVLFDTISSRQIREGFRRYTGQDYANTAWAFASSNRMTAPFVDALITACEPQLPYFKPMEIASLLWSCAKSGHSRSASMRPALQAAVNRGVQNYNGQAVSNVVWACGRMNSPHKELLNGIATYVMGNRNKLTECKDTEFCNIVWAYGKLANQLYGQDKANQRMRDQWFQMLAEEGASRIQNFNANELKNFVLGLARGSCWHSQAWVAAQELYKNLGNKAEALADDEMKRSNEGFSIDWAFGEAMKRGIIY